MVVRRFADNHQFGQQRNSGQRRLMTANDDNYVLHPVLEPMGFTFWPSMNEKKTCRNMLVNWSPLVPFTTGVAKQTRWMTL